MSGVGLLDSITGGGQAAGSEAQTNVYLQLFARLVAAAEAANKGNPYVVRPFTAAGDLNIATAFPGVTTGTVSVRQGTPGAVNVALPTSGGPWIIGDGAGVASADNITVLPASGSGQTINGGSSFVISTDWQFLMFILDGDNWIVVGA